MAQPLQTAPPMDHPVRLQVDGSFRMQRIQIAVRLVLLLCLATAGCSSLYWLAYLALPALAAVLCSQDGGAEYLRSRSRPTVRILQWAAGAYAYLWLLTDSAPRFDAEGPVRLEVRVQGDPTPASALARLITSLPALLFLALLSIVAAPLWVIGVVFVLANERVPSIVRNFVSMKLSYQFRLVAYHLSLVDTYPTLADAPLRDPKVERAA